MSIFEVPGPVPGLKMPNMQTKNTENYKHPNFGIFGFFGPGTGLGISKFDTSGSKSPRGLIQSLGGWNRTDFCTHNRRRRYGLDGMD